MAARRKQDDDEFVPMGRPATTPEGRENQLAALAYDLAEKQLREGTASSQVIAQMLKVGSLREKLERERIEHENQMMVVKMEALASQARVEELYSEAIVAMRAYAGGGNELPEGGDDYDDQY